MRNMRVLAVLFGLFAGPAAADVVGITVAADATVTGSVSGKSQIIRASSQIHENERLSANASGNAQIKLNDGTKIVVGPGADVTVDDFVVRKDANQVSAITVRATKGAFRFITGSSDHTAYKIVTPYASIGVRGTAFDVTIANGGTNIALLQGQITVCGRGGKCQRVDRSCTYTFVGGSGGAKTAPMINPYQATQKRELFPLLASQGGLRSEFQRYALSCGTAQLDLRNPGLPGTNVGGVAVANAGPPGNPPGGNPPGGNPPGDQDDDDQDNPDHHDRGHDHDDRGHDRQGESGHGDRD
jgi:hypothetical protein